MGLTVTEKEHWKDRIGKRIEKKIEAIYAEEPNLDDRVQRAARQRALESLGLAELQTQLDTVEQQKDDLEKREKRIKREMLARVRGVPVEDLNDYDLHPYNHEVDSAVRRRQTVHEDELLAESERGQKILHLREEEENLLDTVWLATSPRQLKDLWSKVNHLLGASPTQLEQDALAIAPVEDE
jgi:hypothetical protein